MSKPSTSRGWVYLFCIVPVLAIIAIAMSLLALSPAKHDGPAGDASAASSSLPAPAGAATRARIQASYAALPLAFEPNQGQTDAQVKYVSRASGYTLFLTANEAVFSLRSRSQAGEDAAAAVRMHLVGGNSMAQVSASDQLPGYSNYFIGNDPSKWQSGVPQYARVAYQNVYPGVNLAYHGAQRQLEFDFVVAPGANPEPIGFGFAGSQGMKTDNSGNLIVSSAAGEVVLHKPVAYQEQNGSRQPVDARFALKANNQVAFELGNYDRSRELVIDPSVSYAYSTYLGGSNDDFGLGITFDSTGDAYVTGRTNSTNFPGASNTLRGATNAFVTKMNAGGTGLVFSTYVGGTANDSGNGIALDTASPPNVYVVGSTDSPAPTFPTTTGAYQTTLNGSENAFIVRLNSSGTLTYGTYFGLTGSVFGYGIAVDSATNVDIVGQVISGTIPFSAVPPIQSTVAGGFLAKVNLAGGGPSDLKFSTYLGGTTSDFATAVAADASDNAYVTGQTAGSLSPTSGAFQTSFGGGPTDAFVAGIKADGTGYLFLTYLGGSDFDGGTGIAVDSTGVYVTGETASSNSSAKPFPLKSPLQGTFGGLTFDAFVAKLNPSGTSLLYSTYLGGGANDGGGGIAVDGSGNAYVTGYTASSNFPTTTTPPATQSTFGGGNTDAFVSEISAAGSSLLFSTYLGGNRDEDNGTAPTLGGIAVDSAGANIYVTGTTTSLTDFPFTTGFFQAANAGGDDAFVVKYSQTPSQSFALTATTLSPSSVSPGGSATSTVTVTPNNGFTGSVTLGCTVSPSVSLGPTCSGTASPGTAGGLTVSTTAATAMLRSVPNDGSSGMFYAMLLPITGISLMGIKFNPIRSRRKKLFGLLMIGMVMMTLILMPACGGSSSKTTGSGGTPANTYTITVTGTATGATQTGASPSLTLTVN